MDFFDKNLKFCVKVPNVRRSIFYCDTIIFYCVKAFNPIRTKV